MAQHVEYSASDIRRILQQLFPERRLVLSQFTLFNQLGVARPTGEQSRRGRRCYRLEDILAAATVLALKEEGIPYKNIDRVPPMIQEHTTAIFEKGPGCRLSGIGSEVVLTFQDQNQRPTVLASFLDQEAAGGLFWSFDVGYLAHQLRQIAAADAVRLTVSVAA